MCKCRRTAGWLREVDRSITSATIPAVFSVEYEYAPFGRGWPEIVKQLTAANILTHQTRDGSVRPGEIEWVVGPIDNLKKFKAWSVLQYAIGDYSGNQVNNTCGYHVHVDAANLNVIDLYGLLVIWEKIKPFFGHLYADRLSNPTCKPISQLPSYKALMKKGEKLFGIAKTTQDITSGLKYIFGSLLYGLVPPVAMDLETQREWSRQWNQHMSQRRHDRCRYVDLNIHSYFYRKTIEWRIMGGTTNTDVLIGWPLLCGNMLTLAVKGKKVWDLPPERLVSLLPEGLLQILRVEREVAA